MQACRMRDFRRYSAAIAVFATVLYAALVIAIFGMISLYTDRDVISDSTVGPVVGPVMTASSVLLVLFWLLWIALRVPENEQRIALGTALLLGVVGYLLFCAVGGFFVGLASGDPIAFIGFFGLQLTSPFAISVGILAFIVCILFMLVLASRVGNKGRPRWPWENRDDD
jgi:hypothetical protein